MGIDCTDVWRSSGESPVIVPPLMLKVGTMAVQYSAIITPVCSVWIGISDALSYGICNFCNKK